MKSTPETVQQAQQMVAECIALIHLLCDAGKSVVCIFDFDAVLGAIDSDAVFRLHGGGYDAVLKYLRFEARLAFQPIRPGPWMPAVEECKKLGCPIYIATARGDFLSVRAQQFVLAHEIRPLEMLCVGTQSKRGSYAWFMGRHRDDPNTHFILVDDAKRHVDDFRALVEEWDIADRAHAFQAIPVFEHTEGEYRTLYDTVMSATSSSGLDVVKVDVPGFGELLVVPDEHAGLKRIQELHREALLAAVDILSRRRLR